MPAAARSIALPPATEPVKLMWFDLAGGDQLLRLRVAEHEVLEEPLRQAGLVGRRLKALADEKRLRGVLQEHGVAGHQRREDRVAGGEVRIVPRRDDEHDAERLALHVAAEARASPSARAARAPPRRSTPCSGRAPRARPSRRHSGPAGPSARRAPARSRRSWRAARRAWRASCLDALRDGHVRPLRLRRARARDGGVERRVGRERPLGIDRAVDGGDDFDCLVTSFASICSVGEASVTPPLPSPQGAGLALCATDQYRSNPRFSSQSVIRRSYSNCSQRAVWR